MKTYKWSIIRNSKITQTETYTEVQFKIVFAIKFNILRGDSRYSLTRSASSRIDPFQANPHQAAKASSLSLVSATPCKPNRRVETKFSVKGNKNPSIIFHQIPKTNQNFTKKDIFDFEFVSTSCFVRQTPLLHLPSRASTHFVLLGKFAESVKLNHQMRKLMATCKNLNEIKENLLTIQRRNHESRSWRRRCERETLNICSVSV